MGLTPIFETSTDSKILAALMRPTKVGDVVKYEGMNLAIGRDVRKAAHAALDTARRTLQNEDRMVFAAVRGIGLKRLNDTDIIDLSDQTRDKIRRTIKRAVKKLHCVNYDTLDRAAQTKHNTALSMFGVIGELSTSRSMKQLQSSIDTTSLPVAKAAIAALRLVL